MHFNNNFKNNDIISNNLLTNEVINKLNSFLLPGSNLGNYITISNYVDILDKNNNSL